MGFSDLFFRKFERRLRDVAECFPGADNGILSFDEMQVKSAVGINVKNMTFDGLVDYGKSIEVEGDDGGKKLQDRSADHGLVFMFSSLKAPFYQPIAMFASKGAALSTILAKLILTAIVKLEKYGAKVHDLVCDGAQTNRGLWKEFGVKAEVDEKIICSFAFPTVDNEEDNVRQIYIINESEVGGHK